MNMRIGWLGLWLGIAVCLMALPSGAAPGKKALGHLREPPGALAGVPPYSAPYVQAAPRMRFPNMPNFPEAVDLSTYGWFPPIGDQGEQGSCVSWAAVYYCQGALQRKDRGWFGGASSNLLSPAFSYNQLRANDGGANFSDHMRFLTRVGACPLNAMPYDEDDENTQPDTNAFRRATEARTLGWSWFVVTNDTQLYLIKQHLAATNIVVTAMNVYENFIFCSTNGVATTSSYGAVGANANVMTGQSGSYQGGHGITIVGYDDRKRYGPGGGEEGAFKIANSWGTNWGNAGYFWVSYEYLKTQGTNHQWDEDNIYYVTWDRENYQPQDTATIRVNHPHREQVRLAMGVRVGSTNVYRYYYFGCAYANRTNWNLMAPYMYSNPGGDTNFPEVVVDVSELLHYTEDNQTNTWVLFAADANPDGVTGRVEYVKIEYAGGVSAATNVNVWISEASTNGMDLPTEVAIPLRINRPDPHILFVDEDSDWASPEYSNYKCYAPGYETEPLQSMTTLAAADSNLAFQAVTLGTQALTQATLDSYRAAFWLTGKSFAYANPASCPISSFYRSMITNYLKQGGRLLLEGEATGPTLSAGDGFVTNWLRINNAAWVSAAPPDFLYLNGMAGDPVSGNMVLPYARGVSSTVNFQQRANRTDPGSGAFALFSRSVDGLNCGVRYNSGHYRVVHLPFELHGIADIKDRQRLIFNALMWVMGVNIISEPGPGGGGLHAWTNIYLKDTAILCAVTNNPATSGYTQWVCVGWIGSGSVPYYGTDTFVNVTLTNDSYIEWLWKTNYYVTVTPNGSGAVSDGGWAPYGDAFMAWAMPSNYYYFDAWTGDVQAAGKYMNPVTVTAAVPLFIAANFKPLMTSNNTPQWWLASYGWTDNFSVAAAGDQDNDRLFTWQEWVTLSCPTNPEDNFRLAGQTPLADREHAVLQWTPRSNRLYAIRQATNFPWVFELLATNLTWPQCAYTSEIPAGVTGVYYRIDVRLPPGE